MGKRCFAGEGTELHVEPCELKMGDTVCAICQNGRRIVYVSQDNYYIADLDISEDIVYYCDSATSCIVIISMGYSSYFGKNVAVISHLSRPGRFDNYFTLINKIFNSNEQVKVYCAGANPPDRYKKSDGTYDTTSLRNATQVAKWVSSGNVSFAQVSLKFGQGNPAVYTNNLDCYSLVCGSDGTIDITNDRIYLTDEQRDPTCGIQTLFCMYGNPNVIRNQIAEFTDDEIKGYVSEAHNANLEKAADMSDDEILKTYSSTPEYEVPWFCDSIRQAATYVKNYQNGGIDTCAR